MKINKHSLSWHATLFLVWLISSILTRIILIIGEYQNNLFIFTAPPADQRKHRGPSIGMNIPNLFGRNRIGPDAYSLHPVRQLSVLRSRQPAMSVVPEHPRSSIQMSEYQFPYKTIKKCFFWILLPINGGCAGKKFCILLIFLTLRVYLYILKALTYLSFSSSSISNHNLTGLEITSGYFRRFSGRDTVLIDQLNGIRIKKKWLPHQLNTNCTFLIRLYKYRLYRKV